MPVCPQCDNRPFSNKEALLQHMKSSSAWHPFCSICVRRFVSQTAFDAHMAAKHPPTYDCVTCNKSFHAPFALEDHYRGSQSHPNCVRCGRGFFNEAGGEEHLRTAHPKSPCGPCGGILIYDDTLDQHYSDSPNHPSCLRCARGFKDDSAYSEHIALIHSDLHCKSCRMSFETPEATQAHFWISPSHPKCDQCNMGFENDESRDSHFDMVHAPTPTAVATQPASAVPTLEPEEIQNSVPQESLLPAPELTPLYSTGFTPLSPKSHAQRLIMGDRRVDSPDLQLQMNFTSPLTDVKPLFSPTSLPRPGGIIEELWSSRENVQVPTTRTQRPGQERSGSLGSTFVPASGTSVWSPTTSTPTQNPQRPASFVTSPVASTSRPTLFRVGNSSPPTFRPSHTFSPPRSYYEPPPRSHHSTSTYAGPSNSSTTSSFDTPFTARTRESRHVSPPLASPPRPEFHSRLYPGSVRHAARAASLSRPSPPTEAALGDGDGSGYMFSFANRTSGSTAGVLSSSYGRARGSAVSDQVNWQQLIGSGNGRSEFGSEGGHPRLFDENLSTPRAEASSSGMQPILHESHPDSLQVHNLPASPSLATVSSPASSALGHSPGSMQQEPETRPTTASSTRTPSLHGLVYTVTPSSECPSPRSPEVTSPIGLGMLPTISPLISTPIEVSAFDIPEAKQPLPESPPPELLSPVTVVLEVDQTTQELDPGLPYQSVSPLSASESSVQSYITSPQEPPEDVVIPVLQSKSIQASVATSSPLTPTVAPTTNPNPLHCRVCLADSCDDITASMCGHIFCNRCITDAVIKTNRCPVCMTPTLLYCLFRLDLPA